MWDRTRVPDEAAYAPNWWRILLIDGCIGLALIVVGVLAGIGWTPIAFALVPLGVFYDYLVTKRMLRWRRLRQGESRP